MPDLFGNDDTPQAKGGRARAASLSDQDRKRIARRGAEARWNVLKATHDSGDHPLDVAGTLIPCYVLEDGRRVLSLGGMVRALGMSIGSASRRQGDRLVNFATGRAISPFVANDLLSRMKEPIRFQAPSGGTVATGYEATILPDLCDAVLQARAVGALRKDQLHIAEQCEILVRSFARVGIIALVDEATGYQEIRDRRALEEILNKYLAEELRRYTRTFPDAYFSEMFRLRKWKAPVSKHARPGAFARLTNNIVYERLAPGLLEELQSRNPTDGHGRRRHKHFQYLSDDFGDPRLREHLDRVVFLMKACGSWSEFERLVDRAAPRVKAMPELDLQVPG